MSAPVSLGCALLCMSLAMAPLGLASAQQTPAPHLTVIGVGAGVPCAEWSAAGRSDPELEQWAFAFASAVAANAQLQRGGGPMAGMDADTIHAG